MKPMAKWIGVLGLLVWSTGCASINQFSLPNGDAERGRLAFIELGCNQCHSATGVARRSGPVDFHLALGSVTGEKSYVELVTSIINPSHRIARPDGAIGGRSRMPNFNTTMTVQELTDLVHYLAPQYELLVVPEFHYPEYDYFPH